MTGYQSTTPFGQRPMSHAMLKASRLAETVRSDAAIGKWPLFRAVAQARVRLGLSDRSLIVLNALLTFYPEETLEGDRNLVVFPSNQQLSLRAHGMASATLRRHLAALVEAGLLLRRDSPNGKRYARRDGEGEIDQAFGFDLAPLLARAAEIEATAQQIAAEQREIRLVRERISLLRRDIGKIAAYALEEAISGDWAGLIGDLADVTTQLRRSLTRGELLEMEGTLEILREKASNWLEKKEKSENTSGNDAHNERLIHNSKTKPLEFEPALEKEHGAIAAPTGNAKVRPLTGYPLALVLRACPDIETYAKDGISDWSDLIQTAHLVREALGISADAWEDCVSAMGTTQAAISIAGILQKADGVRAPGGYLRALTMKAKAGSFTVGPMLMALLRENGTTGRKSG
ncbi:plasmid replication protein RepC [Limoniibacter endophyticus]|uniref:Putative replication protein C n=1 Tax=Limoniibacter endophyticus TaxID=1565040 RepID=A0A8J3DIY3_9HYPH|nr:plasmid replication protein RepC [Limoniibacter endophyticus]GHC72819.1 putative replication protein C [Limoniibacter endophyticus]